MRTPVLDICEIIFIAVLTLWPTTLGAFDLSAVHWSTVINLVHYSYAKTVSARTSFRQCATRLSYQAHRGR